MQLVSSCMASAAVACLLISHSAAEVHAERCGCGLRAGLSKLADRIKSAYAARLARSIEHR